MKTLLTISVIFVIGGTLGWILEFFYRRLAHGKWINPGFPDRSLPATLRLRTFAVVRSLPV